MIFRALAAAGLAATFFLPLTAHAEELPADAHLWPQECETSKYLDSCKNLARQYLRGDGVAKSEVMAAKYYFMACDEWSDEESCGNTIALTHDKPEFRTEFVMAMSINCGYGTLHACKLGYKHTSGPDNPYLDMGRAVFFARTACETEGRYCYNVAMAYEPTVSLPGYWLEPNLARSREYYDAGCKLAHDRSCVMQLYWGVGSKGAPVSKPDIKAALTQGCNIDAQDICARGVDIYWLGSHGIARSPERAYHFAKAACFSKYDKVAAEKAKRYAVGSCDFAAKYARSEREKTGTVTLDDATVSKRGCELGGAASCYVRAQVQYEYKKYADVRQLMEKSCNLGFELGCEWSVDDDRAQRAEKARRAASQQRAAVAQIPPPVVQPTPSLEQMFKAMSPFRDNGYTKICSRDGNGNLTCY